MTIITDRQTYFDVSPLNEVLATVNITFNGNGPLDRVRFEWFDPGATVPFMVHYVDSPPLPMNPTQVTDRWFADRTGFRFNVTASINDTVGSGIPVPSPPNRAIATFDVRDRNALVTVTDITVRTASIYENNTMATARADLTVQGGAMNYLGDIRFDWFYPDGSPAYNSTNASAPAGVSWSNWTVDRTGSGYHVRATYVPKSSVNNTTTFDVVPPTVSIWDPVIGPGQVVLGSGNPDDSIGFCRNTTVPAQTRLIIMPGTVIRFCPNTGLFVNGTLIVDAPPPLSRVFFLSYSRTPRAGDWRGITFFSVANRTSILFNAVVRDTTVGVTVQGMSLAILNTTFEETTGPGIWLVNSSTVVGNNTFVNTNIGIRVDSSTGAVLDSNRIQDARIGVLVQDSDIRLHANVITGAAQIGLQGVQAVLEVDGGLIRDSGVSGVYVTNAPRLRVTSASILGGDNSLQVEGSSDVVVDRSVLFGARLRALYLTGTPATVVNTTLASESWDIQLISSPTTLINCTFSTVFTPVNSVLVVRNFLHVLVQSGVASVPRVPGAWVNVSANGTPTESRRTNAAGLAQWILLTDRYIDSNRTSVVTNILYVEANGFLVPGSPKNVDMTASHLEAFTAVSPPTDGRPGNPAGIDPLWLVLLAAALGSALVAMPAMKRWRENGNGKPKTPAHQVVLEPGTAYLLEDEKPDRAFQIFDSQLAKGAKGLVVTRIYPDDVRRRFRLKEDVPVLWLSRGYGKSTVNPTNLGAMIQDIEKFVSGKEDSVVVFDGLEYLLVQNDAQKVVKFVQTLADTASMHHTKVLLPFNTKAVGEAQRALLTRDLQPL